MNWQLIIIIVYFALTMAIGILASRKTKSSDSFVGAGMGVFAIVCVACGQWLGGTATTGCSEYGFTSGISGWWYTIANGIGMLMMGLFFAEKYRKYGEVTIPGIIERVVGPKSRTVCSILLIFVMLAVGLSQMIAAGKLGQSLLGMDFTLSCCIFALIFIIYTMSGGVKSMAKVAVVQGVVMLLATFSIIGVLCAKNASLYGSFRGAMEHLGAEYPKELQAQTAFSFWSALGTALFAGVGLGAMPHALTVTMTYNNHKKLKQGIIISCVIFTLVQGIMCFTGPLAFSINPNLVTRDYTTIYTATNLLPSWLGGIIFCGVFAAIQSSIAGMCMAGAAALSKDFIVDCFRPKEIGRAHV